MIEIEQDTRLSSVGRPKVVTRAVCGDCGWTSRWATGHWWADAQRDEHAKTCTAQAPRPVFVGQFEHGSPDWHAARAAGLGGSEVSALFGLSPWESEFSLYHRKAGSDLPDRVNDEMRAGTLLEPVIVAEFARRHPDWLVQPKAGTWRHAVREWQIANPDALISLRDPADPARVTGALLETKFALQHYGWGPSGSDEIPPYYACQVQWYLDVLGLVVCWLMVFIGGSAEFREYEIRADPARQAELRTAAEAFLARVAAGQAPPIDGHDATYDTVRDLHPDIDPYTVDLPAELAQSYCTARHTAEAAAVEAKRQTALVAEFMGSAQYARYAGRTIARRQTKGGGTPYVVAGRDLPFHDTNTLEAAS